MAVGGDGTINEVVNGLMKAGPQLPSQSFRQERSTILRLVDIPADPFSYARMIMNFRTLKVDVGKAGSRYFLNVAAGGLLTDIAYKVPSEAKTSLGPLAYWLEGVKDIPNSLFKGLPLTIESKYDRFDSEALLFLIANTTSVENEKIIPLRRYDGRSLDVLIVSKLDSGRPPLLGN
jgi:diacylglycerol kinase (ATP)